ncbi:hypothetical protein H4R24_004368 [Coemansia sp. RSA 988]|nr:hypothetical protein H4R24_004368 [Coemansia sp. RSA 988]
MWNQVVFLAVAFGLGYYVATRGSDKSSRSSEYTQTDSHPTMAGTFPKQDSAEIEAEHKQGNHPNTRGRSAKSKRPRKPKAEHKQKTTAQVPAQNTSAPTTSNEVKKSSEPNLSIDGAGRKEKTKSSAVDTATTAIAAAAAAAVPTTTTKTDTIPSSAPVAEPQPVDWVAVGNRGARPQATTSAPIPVHDTPWSSMASEVDLDEDQNKRPKAARILRIGAPAKPPPAPMPQRRQYTAPPPLTKKQRQSRKKAERQRQERAEAATIQEQRLHSHRRDLFDMRSREQWERERRKALNGPPKGAPPKQAKGAPSIIDGKLIWN